MRDRVLKRVKLSGDSDLFFGERVAYIILNGFVLSKPGDCKVHESVGVSKLNDVEFVSLLKLNPPFILWVVGEGVNSFSTNVALNLPLASSWLVIRNIVARFPVESFGYPCMYSPFIGCDILISLNDRFVDYCDLERGARLFVFSIIVLCCLTKINFM